MYFFQIELVANTKGGYNLHYKSYRYYLRSTSKSETFSWICAFASCKKILVTDFAISQVISEEAHSHEPDPDKADAIKNRAQLRKDGTNSSRSTSALVGEAVQKVNLEIRKKMGKLSTLYRSTRRYKSVNYSSDPKHIKDFNMRENWKYTSLGEHFLIHDSGNLSGKKGLERVMIFATNGTLKYL